MASDKQRNDKSGGIGKHEETPEWANGLKQLYDSVVDEPLPETFKDLLAKLDESDAAPSDGAPRQRGTD
ncbi:MAG: NepR family anti-sigma factor [Pseudomonadota bacterium]